MAFAISVRIFVAAPHVEIQCRRGAVKVARTRFAHVAVKQPEEPVDTDTVHFVELHVTPRARLVIVVNAPVLYFIYTVRVHGTLHTCGPSAVVTAPTHAATQRGTVYGSLHGQRTRCQGIMCTVAVDGTDVACERVHAGCPCIQPHTVQSILTHTVLVEVAGSVGTRLDCIVAAVTHFVIRAPLACVV